MIGLSGQKCRRARSVRNSQEDCGSAASLDPLWEGRAEVCLGLTYGAQDQWLSSHKILHFKTTCQKKIRRGLKLLV